MQGRASERRLRLSAYVSNPGVSLLLAYRDIWDPPGRIFDAFSLDRCMWGTDWTRAIKLLTYAEGLDAFRLADRLSDGDRAKLMGGTASRIYNWSPSKA